MTIRKVRSLKARSIPNCETSQCCGFSIQTSRFYENPSCVSCFLLEPYHAFTIPIKRPWSLPPIEDDGEHKYEMEDVLDS